MLLLIGAMSARIVLASHHMPQIAFTSTRDGNPEIYVMDADGNNQIRLTRHREEDKLPSWSPDGGRIAFASNRDGGINQIYVMDSDGKNLKRLTEGISALNPAWSPDGRTIAYDDYEDKGEDSKIYLVAPDGTNRRRLAGDIPSHDRQAAWSPDSQRIAFTSLRKGRTEEIYVMDADGTNQKRLTHDWRTNREPAWSPDGRKIAFWSELGEDIDIIVMNPDGTNRQNLTEEALDGVRVANVNPAWSPDGRKIAYSSGIFGRIDEGGIHLMTADGQHLKRLGNLHQEANYDPDWFDPATLAVPPTNSQITMWGRLKRLGSNTRSK